MSVFSDTQGTPERVYALMKLIEAAGPTVSRRTAADLLDPKFRFGRSGDQERSDFTQTLRAAMSLGLVVEEGGSLANADGEAPQTYLDFGDIVHARLLSSPPNEPNGTVLDAFALFAERIEADGDGQWLATASNDALADSVRSLLASKRPEAGTFNSTRIAPLFKWMGAIGLTSEVGARQRAIPDVTRRLSRELRMLSGAARLEGLPSAAFVAWALERMPYLPGGSRFTSLFGDLGTTGAGRLTIVLSAALRDLHDDGVIRLEVVGDAAGSARLAGDRFHRLEAFDSVQVPAVEEAT